MNSKPTARSSKPFCDEEQLVRQAQAGDAEAFASLHQAFVDRIYRYVYFRVAHDQTTEDLTSEVFLSAWENLHRYRPRGVPFVAWLYRIAHNAVIDHYRTHKETVPLEDAVLVASDDSLDEELDLELDIRKVRSAMKTLTGEQQQVLTLKFIAGMSTSEVAKEMGKRQGAVRALQMRGLHKLAEHMEGPGEVQRDQP